jgi:hypothetical protein
VFEQRRALRACLRGVERKRRAQRALRVQYEEKRLHSQQVERFHGALLAEADVGQHREARLEAARPLQSVSAIPRAATVRRERALRLCQSVAGGVLVVGSERVHQDGAAGVLHQAPCTKRGHKALVTFLNIVSHGWKE